MKNVVITGAAGNLGRAFGERFIKEEYRVIAIVSMRDPVDLIGDSEPDDNFSK